MPVFTALPTAVVGAYRAGGPDAFGNLPERALSDGGGNPCRHCLCNIPKGAEMLVMAHKPFVGMHPYTEVGPIFLCAAACPRGGGTNLPPILTTSPDYLVKGYCAQDRIVYGTGAIVLTQDLSPRLSAILTEPDVAYVHIRSARNNCYLVGVDPDD